MQDFCSIFNTKPTMGESIENTAIEFKKLITNDLHWNMVNTQFQGFHIKCIIIYKRSESMGKLFGKDKPNCDTTYNSEILSLSNARMSTRQTNCIYMLIDTYE